MQWSRVKTILLILLLIVNVFLIANIAIPYYQEYKRQTNLETNTREILKEKNILISENIFLNQKHAFEWFETQRDTKQEIAATEAFVSSSSVKLQEENIRNGIVWETVGKLSATIPRTLSKWPADEIEAQQMAIIFLEKANFNLSNCGLKTTLIGDNYSVEIVKKQAGIPILNQTITVMLKIDLSVELQGQWLFLDYQLVGRDIAPPYGQIDVLLSAMTNRSNLSILAMEYNYMIFPQDGARVQLRPVWRIETTRGDIYIDIIKNREIQIS